MTTKIQTAKEEAITVMSTEEVYRLYPREHLGGGVASEQTITMRRLQVGEAMAFRCEPRGRCNILVRLVSASHRDDKRRKITQWHSKGFHIVERRI